MDSGLAKVNGLGPFGLKLLIEDQNAVEPEPRVSFVLVLRPVNVRRQLVPFTGREIRFPVRAVAPQVPRTVLNECPAPFFRLDPPGHYVVVFRRRGSLPIEEVVAVLRWLDHVHVKGHVGVGTLFDRDRRSPDLHSQLLSVEYVIFVDGELAGVVTFLDYVGYDLDVSRCRILVARAGLAPLAEIARLEAGLEDYPG